MNGERSVLTLALRVRLWWLAALLSLSAALLPSYAAAERYSVGQRVECDGSNLNKYFKPGVVVAFRPGETYNGYDAASGYFYRVRFDDPAFGESLCQATSMHATQAAKPVASPAQLAFVARGSQYGARTPLPCPKPIKSPPTAPQIRSLVQCRLESETGHLLYLVNNLNIEIGKPRRYNYNADSYETGIDPAAPVIPLRGSFNQYQCSAMSENPAGKNCTIYMQPSAHGECFRTSFGDWQCNLQGTNNDDNMRRFHQAPPQ